MFSSQCLVLAATYQRTNEQLCCDTSCSARCRCAAAAASCFSPSRSQEELRIISVLIGRRQVEFAEGRRGREDVKWMSVCASEG